MPHGVSCYKFIELEQTRINFVLKLGSFQKKHYYSSYADWFVNRLHFCAAHSTHFIRSYLGPRSLQQWAVWDIEEFRDVCRP